MIKMFIAILNPIVSFLIEQKKQGKDHIKIEFILEYIQMLDKQEKKRILKAFKGDDHVG